MVSSYLIHRVVTLLLPIDIKNICIFIGPIYASFTVIATYLLIK